MAVDDYIVFEGSVGTSDTSVQLGGVQYTPREGRMFAIRGAAFHNTNSATQVVNLKAGSTCLIAETLQSGVAKIFNCENAILNANEKLYVKGQVANDIKYRLWGIEMDA